MGFTQEGRVMVLCVIFGIIASLRHIHSILMVHFNPTYHVPFLTYPIIKLVRFISCEGQGYT